MFLKVFSKIRRIGKRQAYLDYHDYEDSLTYWRTDSGYEVDAVLGEGKVAIESFLRMLWNGEVYKSISESKI